MVRQTEATTEARTIENAEDVEVGDIVDISGRDFLPKSNLEVVEVDPEWADRYDDARVFTARIPNRSNARDYTFKVSSYGSVVTTGHNGTFENYALTAKKIVEVEPVDEYDAEDDDTDGVDDVEEGDTVTLTYESRRSDNDITVEGDVVYVRRDEDGDARGFNIDAGTTENPDSYKVDHLNTVSSCGERGSWRRIGRVSSIEVYGDRDDDARSSDDEEVEAATDGGYVGATDDEVRDAIEDAEDPKIVTDGGFDVDDDPEWFDDRFARDHGPTVDGGDVDRCEMCKRYAPHAFDHAPDCPMFEPIDDAPDADGTDLQTRTHDVLRARLKSLEDAKARAVDDGSDRRYRRLDRRESEVRAELVRRAAERETETAL